ncbi:hypothetical protein L218DRAFT_861623 [Marasmius fiardii PR-910]|nr:hypothetical protein L218DRAFT_861623 [Marasmius fiardii PR-910]
MLEAFKLKPFDLEPIFSSWTDGPRFTGNPKKDPPVDEWLKKIKAGCEERNVPKEYWHKVGRHFMGEKAKARLDELKSVMAKVHGGNYRWNWEKYKIAMRNMGWNLEDSTTETIKVKSKASGLWWIVGGRETKETEAENHPKGVSPTAKEAPLKPKRSDSSFWLSRKPTTESKEAEKSTDDKEKENVSQSRPVPVRSSSVILNIFLPSATVTTVTQAPLWLINACSALDFIQTEHPKVMSTISAILITVGTIPSIPAISAGAGGALLASGAVQAAGAIAVGVGSWLKTQQEVRSADQQSEIPSK